MVTINYELTLDMGRGYGNEILLWAITKSQQGDVAESPQWEEFLLMLSRFCAEEGWLVSCYPGTDVIPHDI